MTRQRKHFSINISRTNRYIPMYRDFKLEPYFLPHTKSNTIVSQLDSYTYINHNHIDKYTYTHTHISSKRASPQWFVNWNNCK